MHAEAKPDNAETIAVGKQDLINAWTVLEKIAVSIDKIGSAYAVPAREDWTPEIEQRMLVEIGQFIRDHVADEANRFRQPLSECLSEDEAETLSDQIDYWQASKR
jgi:hypothetical protein